MWPLCLRSAWYIPSGFRYSTFGCLPGVKVTYQGAGLLLGCCIVLIKRYESIGSGIDFRRRKTSRGNLNFAKFRFYIFWIFFRKSIINQPKKRTVTRSQLSPKKKTQKKPQNEIVDYSTPKLNSRYQLWVEVFQRLWNFPPASNWGHIILTLSKKWYFAYLLASGNMGYITYLTSPELASSLRGFWAGSFLLFFLHSVGRIFSTEKNISGHKQRWNAAKEMN